MTQKERIARSNQAVTDTFATGTQWANGCLKPEMVNKQKFIAKVKRWLELETDWGQEWDAEGRNPDYGKIDELVKYLEE